MKKRERVGREEPGSVLRGPPITITCECGEKRHLHYWGGDHSLFLGRVEYARQHPGTPLLFHGGRYERLGSS